MYNNKNINTALKWLFLSNFARHRLGLFDDFENSHHNENKYTLCGIFFSHRVKTVGFVNE
jgi:hypothetical protein